VDALLEGLEPVYFLLVCVVAVQPAARFRALAGVSLTLLGLATAAERVAGPGTHGAFNTSNEVLAGAAILGVLAVVLRGLLRSGGPRPPAPSAPQGGRSQAESQLDLLLVAGSLLAAFSPHLLLLGLGMLLGLASAVRAVLRAGRPLALVLLLAGGGSVTIGLVLMLTILGPDGGRVARLAEGPFSLAAERLLVLLIGSASLLLAGLPPFHQLPWGRRLAPLSTILLVRLIAGPFPLGLATWQAPLLLMLLAGLVWGALRNQWPLVAVAGGMMAIGSGMPAGVRAGCVLVAWGWLVESGAVVAARRGVTLRARWAGLPALPAALAGLPALTAGLRAQVLISVLAVAACAGGLLLRWKRDGRALQAPLY
jgi:hypothetical protein